MYRGVKRALDFITALLALIVLSPLLAITALAVKLDSKGPAIFKQQRLGLHGKTFWIYKFRSMCQGAEHTGTRRVQRRRRYACDPSRQAAASHQH